MHLIVDALNAKLVDGNDIKVIAKNAEKFVGMEVTGKKRAPQLKLDFDEDSATIRGYNDKIRFVDTLQFMPSSLSALVKNVKKGGLENLDVIKSGFHKLMPWFKEPTIEQLKLFTKKHSFPFKFLSDKSKFEANVKVPGREEFTNDLTGEKISDKHWERVKEVINEFKLERFCDYTKFYCNSDVLLLAQVWVNYARTGYNSYGLDPTYVYSAPSYSYECCFYHTKAKVQCITDERMLSLIQRGMRGGQTFGTVKHATSFTERFGHEVKDDQDRRHIAYFDLNSLYSYALCGPLPYTELNYINDKHKLDELLSVDWKNFDENGDIGYIICCTLQYPRAIHEPTRDIPLAAEHRYISRWDLSPEQLDLVETLKSKGVFTKIEQQRLLLTCYDKVDYVLNHTHLKYLLNSGMILESISEAMSFKQARIFESYIRKNLEFRNQAKNDFESMYFKLLNNR